MREKSRARDLDCIVKAALSRRLHAYRRNRLAFGWKRCEPVPPRARLDFSTWNSERPTTFPQPSPQRSGENGRFPRPGTSSKIRRRRRWGRKRRFIRETEVDGDAKARPLGVRFYLSRRGFLFHGKYPGHLGVRRSPIYGLLGRPRLPSPFLRAPFPAPLRSNCRPALPPFVFRSFPRLASSPEHLFSSSSR